MKAVLQFRASPAVQARVQRRLPPWLEVVFADPTQPQQLLAAITDAQVLLHVLSPVTSELLRAAPQLRLVQKIGVGVNTIDRDAARARGIVVANMPGTNSQAVAEHALALMLAVLRRVCVLNDAMRQGQGWQLPLDALDSVGEIAGSHVALVGFGAVPQKLAPVLKALGARVSYFARTDKKSPHAQFQPSLEALLREADIVSLHLPLDEKTQGLMSTERLGWIRPGGILVNCARGELVDEIALQQALLSGALSGAGSDVFSVEPCDANHPLMALDNFVATPHVAWLTPQTLERSLDVAVENCRRLRDGEPLLHVVP